MINMAVQCPTCVPCLLCGPFSSTVPFKWAWNAAGLLSSVYAVATETLCVTSGRAIKSREGLQGWGETQQQDGSECPKLKVKGHKVQVKRDTSDLSRKTVIKRRNPQPPQTVRRFKTWRDKSYFEWDPAKLWQGPGDLPFNLEFRDLSL